MIYDANKSCIWSVPDLTSKKAAVGERLWFIQHPGGGQKQIGYYEDRRKTTFCKVDRIDQTYVDTTSGSQMAYGCDSEGGSSGSPVINATTGRVFGLHHYGGVSSNPCLNAATEMPEICSDAGNLLSCATN